MGVNITRAKGQLRLTQPTEDAVICLVISGAAVNGKIALSDPKQIFGSDALTTLGITAGNNALAYKEISDFYKVAGEGAELNLMLVTPATSLSTVCDKASNIAKKLLNATDGRAVVLLVNRKPANGYTPTITNGLDADVWGAVTKLNELALDFDNKNIPFVGVLPGLGFSLDTISDFPNRSTLENDYAGLNCYCENNDGNVSMGLLAGWIAKHQVHENVGRVASGRVSDTAFLPDGLDVGAYVNFVTPMTNKGILFPVKIGSKAGYFFNDDPTITAITSDYSSISWNRVINKAKRIAYGILIEKLNDDVDVNENTGLIETSVASDWESDVENAIRSQMMKTSASVKKEISGVKCTVDPNSDILNSQVEASIDIVRKGQAKNISVKIGYVVSV